MCIRKESSRTGKDKVNVLTMLQNITNLPCWYFLGGIGLIIIESVSMNSCVFVLATEDFLYATRQSLGQPLALVYDTDRLLPEPCCVTKREAGSSRNSGNTAKLQ